MPDPTHNEHRKPVWGSTRTKKIADCMAADAKAHDAEAHREAEAGNERGAKRAAHWAEMKRRAAELLHESAEAEARREQARADARTRSNQ